MKYVVMQWMNNYVYFYKLYQYNIFTNVYIDEKIHYGYSYKDKKDLSKIGIYEWDSSNGKLGSLMLQKQYIIMKLELIKILLKLIWLNIGLS